MECEIVYYATSFISEFLVTSLIGVNSTAVFLNLKANTKKGTAFSAFLIFFNILFYVKYTIV